VVKLSIFDDELALTGLAQVMSSVLVKFNSFLLDEKRQQEESWWNNLGSYIGNIFVGDEERRNSNKIDDAILLVFYELIHLNRNFISVLTHAASEYTSLLAVTSVEQDETSLFQPQLNYNSPNEIPAAIISENNDGNETQNNTTQTIMQTSSPSNLLVVFLQSCSAILQETKLNVNNVNESIKLIMIILVCISEDQYANSLLHDSNMTFSVVLYQAKFRHRRVNYDKLPPSRILVSAVLDLMIEFMQSHLMKNFPFELYNKSIGIIQRLMCYQKKYKVKLDYDWKSLWTCLLNVLKYLTASDSYVSTENNKLFQLYSKIIIIFNILITYGDTFLPNPDCYDYLYYDIMRMKHVFDNLSLLANKYVAQPNLKESVTKLILQLINIKSIINHFSPIIDAWSTANHVSSLTEQQVLDIVKNNYETLTLKLEDNLDQFERYCEHPQETDFFDKLLKRIITETRFEIDLTKFDHPNVMQEILSNST